MRVLNNIALILTIIGGINWGSIGLHMLVNGMSMWALNALSNL